MEMGIIGQGLILITIYGMESTGQTFQMLFGMLHMHA
jgi:hypothetical protein